MNDLSQQKKSEKKIKNLPGRPKGTSKKQKLKKNFQLNVKDFQHLDHVHSDRKLRKLDSDVFPKAPCIVLDRLLCTVVNLKKSEPALSGVQNATDQKSPFSTTHLCTKTHLDALIVKEKDVGNNGKTQESDKVNSLGDGKNTIHASNNIVTELDVNKLKLKFKNLINNQSSATSGDDKLSRDHPGGKSQHLPLSCTLTSQIKDTRIDNNSNTQLVNDSNYYLYRKENLNKENETSQCPENAEVPNVLSEKVESVTNTTDANIKQNLFGDKSSISETEPQAENGSEVIRDLPILAEIKPSGVDQVCSSQPPVLTPMKLIDTSANLVNDVIQDTAELMGGENSDKNIVYPNHEQDKPAPTQEEHAECTTLQVVVIEETLHGNSSTLSDKPTPNKPECIKDKQKEKTDGKICTNIKPQKNSNENTVKSSELMQSVYSPSIYNFDNSDENIHLNSRSFLSVAKKNQIIKKEPVELLRKPLHQHDGYDSDATMIYDEEDERSDNIWMYRYGTDCNPLKIKQTQQLLRLKSKIVQSAMDRNEIVKTPETLECIESLYPSSRGEDLDKSEDTSSKNDVSDIEESNAEPLNDNNIDICDAGKPEIQTKSQSLEKQKPINKLRIALKMKAGSSKHHKHKHEKKNSGSFKLSASKWDQAITSAEAVVLTDLTISRGNAKQHSEKKKKGKIPSPKKAKAEKRNRHDSQDMVLKNINKIFPKPRRKRSKDEDDLPTILPPKRRRHGKAQVTTESKSDIDRINQEFPQFNWLEKKYMDKVTVDGALNIKEREKETLEKSASRNNKTEDQEHATQCQQLNKTDELNDHSNTQDMEYTSMIMDNADNMDSLRIDYRNHTENEALQTEPTQDTEDTIMDNQSLSPSESHLIIAEDIEENNELSPQISEEAATGAIDDLSRMQANYVPYNNIPSNANSQDKEINSNVSITSVCLTTVPALTKTSVVTSPSDNKTTTDNAVPVSMNRDDSTVKEQSTPLLEVKTTLNTSTCPSVINGLNHDNTSVLTISTQSTNYSIAQMTTAYAVSRSTPTLILSPSTTAAIFTDVIPSVTNSFQVKRPIDNNPPLGATNEPIAKQPKVDIVGKSVENKSQNIPQNIPPLIPVSETTKQNKQNFSKSKLLGPEVEATYNEIKQLKKALAIRLREEDQMRSLLKEKEEMLRTMLLSSPLGPNKINSGLKRTVTSTASNINLQSKSVSCENTSSFNGVFCLNSQIDLIRLPPPAHSCKKENTKEILKTLEANPIHVPPDIKATCPFIARKRPLSPPTTRYSVDSWQGPLPVAHAQKPFEVPGSFITVKNERCRSQEKEPEDMEVLTGTSRALSAPAQEAPISSPINLQQKNVQTRASDVCFSSSASTIQPSSFHTIRSPPSVQTSINNHFAPRQYPISSVRMPGNQTTPVNMNKNLLSPHVNIHTENTIQQELHDALKRRQKDQKLDQDYQQFKISKPNDNSQRLKSAVNNDNINKMKDAPVFSNPVPCLQSNRPSMHVLSKIGNPPPYHGELITALQRTTQNSAILSGRSGSLSTTMSSANHSHLPPSVRLIGATAIPSCQSTRMTEPNRLPPNHNLYKQQQFSPASGQFVQSVIRQRMAAMNVAGGTQPFPPKINEGGKLYQEQVAVPIQQNIQLDHQVPNPAVQRPISTQHVIKQPQVSSPRLQQPFWCGSFRQPCCIARKKTPQKTIPNYSTKTRGPSNSAAKYSTPGRHDFSDERSTNPWNVIRSTPVSPWQNLTTRRFFQDPTYFW